MSDITQIVEPSILRSVIGGREVLGKGVAFNLWMVKMWTSHKVLLLTLNFMTHFQWIHTLDVLTLVLFVLKLLFQFISFQCIHNILRFNCFWTLGLQNIQCTVVLISRLRFANSNYSFRKKNANFMKVDRTSVNFFVLKLLNLSF